MLELQQSAVLVASFSYRSPYKPQDEAQPSTTNQQLEIEVSQHLYPLEEHGKRTSPTSIAIAVAKFGIMVDARAISSTSSFFFISQSF